MSTEPERLRLDPQVALRPEPFGALAYHYGTRRLSFLRSPELLELVRCLGDHPSAQAAFAACGIDHRRWPSFARALASLRDSGMLQPVEVQEPAAP